jgi:hypothetical protein
VFYLLYVILYLLFSRVGIEHTPLTPDTPHRSRVSRSPIRIRPRHKKNPTRRHARTGAFIALTNHSNVTVSYRLFFPFQIAVNTG